MAFEQYSLVRVRQLLRLPEHYDGWGFNQRPPQVGDIGTLLDILQALGSPNGYIVECSNPDGTDVWLVTFTAEGLESAPPD